MNIGIFTDTFYPEINGVATSVMTLEKELQKLGHNVYIFTTSHPQITKKSDNVFRIPSIPFIFLPSRRMGLIYSRKVARRLKQLDLDIVHTQTEFSLGFFGKLMARRFGLPIVHTYHTMYKDYAHYISKGKFVGITNEMARQFSRNFCNSCDIIVAPTKKVFDLLKEYDVHRPVKIIPTGINLDYFRKKNSSPKELIKLRKQLGIGETDPVVLCLGRIAKEKSMDIIIREFPILLDRLPNSKLLFVGDGPVKNEIVSLVERLKCGKSVIFAGEHPFNAIGKFYHMSDVFVNASITETQGLTYSEAMSAGIPVVAKYDKNLENLITDHVTGRVFKEDCELSSILYEVLTNSVETERMVQNALKKAEDFSSQNFARSILKVYEEATMSREIEKVI